METTVRSLMAPLMSGTNTLLGLWKKRAPRAFLFRRSEYKAVWNSVSGSEDQAKCAVSGYTDEELYRTTGEGTYNLLNHCVGIQKDDVILEIGAGVGRVGAVLAPLCRQWIGVDVSDNMVRHMKHRLAAHNNVRIVASNGYDLSPIASESVDLVYCTVVFMHLEEFERYGYVKEGFRILKPGGRMYVDNVNLLSDPGWKFFQEHCDLPVKERPPQISHTSTPQELETYFRRAGFSDIKQIEADLWVGTYGRKPADATTAG